MSLTESNDGASAFDDEAIERLERAPEQERERARSVATLVGTAAGASVFGLVFGSSSSALSSPARWVGAVAVGLMLASAALYVSAFNISSEDETDDDEAYVAALKTMHSAIVARGRAASRVGLAGLGLVLATAVVGAALPRDEVRVVVTISEPGLQALAPVCPRLHRTFVGTAATADVAGSTPLLAVRVPPSQCSSGSSLLFIPRTSVLGVQGTS